MVERGGRLVVTVVTALALSACGHDGSPATGAGGDAGSPPTDARPILCPVDNAATTSDVDSIGAGIYPVAASPGASSRTPVSGGPTGSGPAGLR